MLCCRQVHREVAVGSPSVLLQLTSNLKAAETAQAADPNDNHLGDLLASIDHAKERRSERLKFCLRYRLEQPRRSVSQKCRKPSIRISKEISQPPSELEGQAGFAR